MNQVEDGLVDVINQSNSHVADTANPHSVDASDIGLSNVLDVPQVEDAGAAASIQATTSGSRPAASGVNERILFQTDTQQIFRSNGTSWVEFAKAPGQIQANDLGFDVATQSELDSHTSSTSNPHSVTLSQAETAGGSISSGSVSDFAEAVDDRVNALLTSAGAISLSYDDGAGTLEISETHSTTTNNPHSVTAAQVGALASIDGVSNDGGNVDLVAGTNITITPDDGANTITIASSAAGITSIDGVSNSGGNVDLVSGGAISISPDDGADQITISETHSTQTNNPHSVTSAQIGAAEATASRSTEFTGAAPTTYTDLDLSSTIGNNRAFVLLIVTNSTGSNGVRYGFRENGRADDFSAGSATPIHEVTINDGSQGSVWVLTDANGVVEWYSGTGASFSVVELDAWITVN